MLKIRGCQACVETKKIFLESEKRDGKVLNNTTKNRKLWRAILKRYGIKERKNPYKGTTRWSCSGFMGVKLLVLRPTGSEFKVVLNWLPTKTYSTPSWEEMIHFMCQEYLYKNEPKKLGQNQNSSHQSADRNKDNIK